MTRSVIAVLLVGALALGGTGCSLLEEDELGAPFGDDRLEETRRIAADIDAFWVDAADELGFAYEPVPASRITDGTTGASCDGEPLDEDDEDLEENAFVDAGCAEGVLVAVDTAYLFGVELNAEITLAHEWGHVVQGQAPGLDRGVITGLDIAAELQADCFAGAWAATRLSDAQLDVAIGLQEAVGDEPGVAFDEVDAHGTAEERVDAFLAGVDGGVTACLSEQNVGY